MLNVIYAEYHNKFIMLIIIILSVLAPFTM
jgi:hypothetical protein